MRLNKPITLNIEHRADLPKHLNYLAGGPAFISASCGPGGFVNPEYANKLEAIDLRRKVLMLGLSGKSGEEYAAASDAASRDLGEMRIAAIYDHCIESWETNIQDDGKPIAANRENFMALAEVRVPEVSSWFVGLAKHVDDIAKFIRQADEETEKN